MLDFINNLAANVFFILERLNWLSLVDLLLVTAVFFSILMLLRGTQAMVLLRGALIFVAFVSLLASMEVLPAFSWLVQIALPALLLAIPVIFAPEIRYALERLGRAGTLLPGDRANRNIQDTINSVVYACSRLSNRKHGALIVLQRRDALDEYIQTGVYMDAVVTPELLLQVFYPNTPLHDGAVIISGNHLVAAACVLPLSASGVLTASPERQMGLRHRAGLGITEVSDAISVIVSEETGSITIVHSSRMIRRLDPERLEDILRTFFKPPEPTGFLASLSRFLSRSNDHYPEEH